MTKRFIFGIVVLMMFLTGCTEQHYTYIGKIMDIEGGSSSNLVILTVDTIGKTPYTVQNKCSNLIRVGQRVFSSNYDNWLWVEYEPGKYC